MNMDQNLRYKILNTASSHAFHPYTTSAIPFDTERFVYVDAENTENIKSEDPGKYSVFDIADWFLLKEEMTHKKLQKLCYYAQAWNYALNGYRLENTDYQAWIHGPVSPALWEKFKAFGYEPIRIKRTAAFSIDKDALNLLEDVWDTYGENSGNALEALTHREMPWLEARRGYSPNERCSVVISPESMTYYYKSIYCGD